MEYQFVIHTPLMWINKEETWKMAADLGVLDIVKNETLTCYNGIKGDGSSPFTTGLYSSLNAPQPASTQSTVFSVNGKYCQP